MNKPLVKFAFASMGSMGKHNQGIDFFRYIQSEYPAVYPEFAGYTEPVNNKVSDKGGSEMLSEFWENRGLWTKKSYPKHEGQALFPAPKRYSDGMDKIFITMEYTEKFSFEDFLIDTSKHLSADYSVAVIDALPMRKHESSAYQFHHERNF